MGKIISDRRRHSVLYATIEETVTNKKSKAAATCMYAMPSVWPHNFRLLYRFPRFRLQTKYGTKATAT